ncbi:MAG: DUF3298 domain-containing protein [Cytophagales bacterium]|nr:MAG: DUF3298 domain-containing protein [Cytophagales bacterium]
MKNIALILVFIPLSLQIACAQDNIEVLTSGFYTHLVGKLNSQPATMDLMLHEGEHIGTYYINGVGRPFRLKEIKSNSTKRVLEELDSNGHLTGVFEVAISKKGLAGVRETEQGKRKVPVAMSENYLNGSMQFQQYYIHNSKDTKAPFETKVHFLYPVLFADNQVLTTIRADLGKGLFKVALPNNLDIQTFKNQVIEKLNAHYDYMLDGATERENINIDMLVYLNEKFILSVRINEVVDAISEEVDEQKLFTWDLKTGKRLLMTDIFKPNYEEDLRKIILQSIVKKTYKEDLQKAENAKLDKSMIDFDFYMTTGGMTFFYLLPEGDRDLEIYIPFKDMIGLLKENSPISQFWKE